MQCQRLQVIGCVTTNLPTSTRLPSCQMLSNGIYLQKLHSHAYTCAVVCSFVSFTYYLSYFEEMDSNEDMPLMLPFASFVSLSQLIIVI
jgi:hypothetical protein